MPQHVLVNVEHLKLSSMNKLIYTSWIDKTTFEFNGITGINAFVYLEEDIKLIEDQLYVNSMVRSFILTLERAY